MTDNEIKQRAKDNFERIRKEVKFTHGDFFIPLETDFARVSVHDGKIKYIEKKEKINGIKVKRKILPE